MTTGISLLITIVFVVFAGVSKCAMKYSVIPLEDGKHWSIQSNGLEKIGAVERLMTGYLVTLGDKKVKRFRMVDALREALGSEAVIEEISVSTMPTSSNQSARKGDL